MKKTRSFVIATTLVLLVLITTTFSAITVNAEVVTDVTGPTITDAYCDKQGQVLKPGDTVYFSFKAYDESGLRDRVSVNFYEATSYSGRSFNWVYNSSEDKYETTFTVPSSVKMGAYYISTIYMYDVHGNQTALSTHLGFYIEPDGHIFGNWSNLDSNNHKRICSICQKIETELHSGGSSTCTELAKCDICHQSYGSYAEHVGGTATCTVKAKCDVCKQTYGAFAEHNFDETSWDYKNADGHAHVCQTSGCSEHDTVMAHTSSGAATEDVAETCTECGYIIAPALGHKKHTAKAEWTTDDKYHWHECTECEGQQLDKSSHKDLDNNAKCDTCGATVPVGTVGEPDEDVNSDGDGLSVGAIAGIAVGSTAVVGIGGFSLIWFVIKKKSWADFLAIFKK